MPLTAEQFKKARAAGYTVEQIASFEKRRSSGSTVSFPASDQAQSTSNPGVAALKAASEFVPGTLFATQYYAKGGPFNPNAIREAEEVSGPIERAEVQGVPAQIAYGATAAAPILAGAANPFMSGASKALSAGSKIPVIGRAIASPVAKSALGFGAYEGARTAAGGRLEDVPESIKSGALSGALFHVGSKLGATATQPLKALTRQADRIGSALGAGAVSASTAPEGEKVSSGILGGAFGARFPSEPIGYRAPSALIKQAANIYRGVLRPSKGEVKKLEVEGGKNVSKFYELAAKENLKITRTADNKLDTIPAREHLKNRIETVHESLNQVLRSSPAKQFDLVKIGDRAVSKALGKSKTALEKKQEAKQIIDYVNAEISNVGRYVSGEQLNNIKQNLWKVSYNQMQPTAKSSARTLGFAAKDAIESGYPKGIIKGLNEISGQYQTLNSLLANAHGRVVPGGRIGGYVSRAIGAVAGSKVPFVGPIAGAYVGGKVSSIAQNPSVATRIAGKKYSKAVRELNRQYPLDNLLKRLFTRPGNQQEGQATEVFEPFNLIEANAGQGQKLPAIEFLGNTRLGLPEKITTKPGQKFSFTDFQMTEGRPARRIKRPSRKTQRPNQDFSSNPKDIIEIINR